MRFLSAGAGLQPGPDIYDKLVASRLLTENDGLGRTNDSIYKIEPAKNRMNNKSHRRGKISMTPRPLAGG